MNNSFTFWERSHLLQGGDQEGTTSLRFKHYSHKLSVHVTHVPLVGRLADANVIIALVFLVRSSEHMAIFG